MVLMQELRPLLTPPVNMPLQHTGLQRFKHYFNAIAHALPACQADEPAFVAALSQVPAADGFHWTCLTAPAANVLMLTARLTQQLPVTACCEVKTILMKTVAVIHALIFLGIRLCWSMTLTVLLEIINYVVTPACSLIHICLPPQTTFDYRHSFGGLIAG